MILKILMILCQFIFQYFSSQIQDFENCENIDNCLHRLEMNDNLAVATSRFHMKTLNLQSIAYCFRPSENIYSYLTTFMIRSDFKFKDQINDIFGRIISSGLFSKWIKDLRLDQNFKNNEEVRKIDKIDFQILWLIIFWATILSSLVALLEIFINYNVRSKNARRIWKLFDKMLNGKRYILFWKSKQNNPTQKLYGKYKFNRVHLSQSTNSKYNLGGQL